MPVVHNTLPELGPDARVHVVAIAYEPREEDEANVKEGRMGKDQIRFVTVMGRNVPVAAAPYVVEILDKMGITALRFSAFAEVPEDKMQGLGIFLAAISEDDWQDLMKGLRPTNTQALNYLLEHGGEDQVLDPKADA